MAATKKSMYENLAEKAAKGKYSLVAPLDFMILEKLPEEGTLFAGLYPLGETALNLIKKFPKGPDGKALPTTIVSGRFSSLHAQGIIVPHSNVPGSSTNIWQRTKLGTKLFNEWKEKQGGTTTTK